MKRALQGRYLKIAAADEPFKAFVPAPLPPRPDIRWSASLRRRFDDALLALGRLDAVCDLLPSTDLLLYSFVRKEAVLSSMIEGTQSSLADLLLFEIDEQPGVPAHDAREVSRCVAALEHGIARLREGFPLSLRLIREVHEVLMGRGRGARYTPGEFRRTQVWVGGTRPGNAMFVPPPAHEMADCLKALERFMHDGAQDAPTLVRAALTHVQFETIHPFLDGNGRVGRVLIALQLVAEGVLREPLLYVSLHFKQHRQMYYELLNAVRTSGDWEGWLAFFADAVMASARQATAAVKALSDIVREDARRIELLGRASASALVVHRALQRQPIATAASLSHACALTPATVNKALSHLQRVRVVGELTNRRRGRVFCYSRYAAVLNEGMALPSDS